MRRRAAYSYCRRPLAVAATVKHPPGMKETEQSFGKLRPRGRAQRQQSTHPIPVASSARYLIHCCVIPFLVSMYPLGFSFGAAPDPFGSFGRLHGTILYNTTRLLGGCYAPSRTTHRTTLEGAIGTLQHPPSLEHRECRRHPPTSRDVFGRGVTSTLLPRATCSVGGCHGTLRLRRFLLFAIL